VVRELRRVLPDEAILYLGDTARLPYGNKSKSIITRFGFEDSSFLLQRKVKVVVVACHSVSSVCLGDLKKELPVPLVGVVEPGAKAAVAATRNDRIGVIGTRATISAGAYERAIRSLKPGVEIVARPTPLLVPLVEEGWLEHEVTKQVLKEYLTPLINDGIDTLLLGCTHYPLLTPLIQSVVAKEIVLVDPARETAWVVKRQLESHGLLEHSGGGLCLYLSDLTPEFQLIAQRFLGEPIPEVIRATIPELK
jgi:glutamate racemase